ncbi:MAG: adenine phosphoribosyltransferase, partial [Anaerolineae bacterium]
VVTLLAERYANAQVDIVAAIESRGFIFGAPLAVQLGAGFVPVRKPGKLPAQAISESYTLEYGTNTLEMHVDAIQPGQRVLVVDDLLATGGSARAAVNLVERLGGKVVGLAFVVELDFLNGRQKLTGYPVHSLVHYS